MRILYAVQGTGNGHLARAREVVPHLLHHGAVDVLISGQHAEVDCGQQPAYRLKGLGFIFGKSGGVDMLKTWSRNHVRQLLRDVRSVPVQDYDVVINDFEPVTAWACRKAGIPCWGLSHQAAVLHPAAPQPAKSDLMGRFILRQYAPVSEQWGFHFKPYAPGIFSPVIRGEVRALTPSAGGRFVVYLPAYSDEKIIKVLSEVRADFHVFSKHTDKRYRVRNLAIEPIRNEAFLQALASAEGLLCGAGFEAPAEALYLGKKVLAIPMKNQFEQQCNAAALQDLGVPILKNLKRKRLEALRNWVEDAPHIEGLAFPDQTAAVVAKVLAAAQARR